MKIVELNTSPILKFLFLGIKKKIINILIYNFGCMRVIEENCIYQIYVSFN